MTRGVTVMYYKLPVEVKNEWCLKKKRNGKRAKRKNGKKKNGKHPREKLLLVFSFMRC
jgi:hypothetical protein